MSLNTNSLIKNVKTDDNVTRDERFCRILHNQLGKEGINIIVTQSFLFVLVLIMIVAIIIGYISTSEKCMSENRITITSKPQTTVQRSHVR